MSSPTPIYSPCRVAPGGLLFVSGQLPIDSDGAVSTDVAAQVSTVLDNIAGQLRSHGLDWHAVVKLTYYLCDISDLAVLRATADTVLPHPRPAASLVEVSGLVDPRCALEIDAIAQPSDMS